MEFVYHHPMATTSGITVSGVVTFTLTQGPFPTYAAALAAYRAETGATDTPIIEQV